MLSVQPSSFVLNKVHTVESAITIYSKTWITKSCFLQPKSATYYTTHAHHTPNTQAPATLHHTYGREGHTGTGRRGPSELGPSPLLSFKNAKFSHPYQVFQDRIPSFCVAFQERQSRPQTGRNGLKQPSAGGSAETACFVLYNTCKSFAKELTNPRPVSKQP